MVNQKPKKIGIVHYRVGGTDGVALEVAKRKEILEKHGCQVRLIAGPRSRGAHHCIKELEWDDGAIPIIKENGFFHFHRKDLSSNELKGKMNIISRAIEDKLNFIQMNERFDCLLLHNSFTFGQHIASAKAFTKWIKKFKIPTLATHHDLYWERKEFNIPRNEYLRNYMEKFMPPKSKYIEHVVLNTIAKRELKRRSDIDAIVMGDVIDFSQGEWKIDNFNKNFLREFAINPKDLIILQATRVIPRKGIEIAIDFTRTLQEKSTKLKRKKLYNGKKLNAKVKIVLVVAGYAEDEKREYLFKLKSKAFDDLVHVKFISDHVKAKRKYHQGVKTYSLWDAYAHADLVTFPSIWEGWGNQFIEGVFARKPMLVYEYPVFKTDIKKEGYDYISLCNDNNNLKENTTGLYCVPQKNLDYAANRAIRWLTSDNTNKRLEKNFQIGKKYHDYKVLEDFLIKNLHLSN
jgi:glycosyltransferase involved in cell wall biosynthesis